MAVMTQATKIKMTNSVLVMLLLANKHDGIGAGEQRVVVSFVVSMRSLVRSGFLSYSKFMDA